MVNFRVGDRVEVVNSGSSILKNGDIGTITLIESNVAKVFVNGKPNNGNWIKFESLKLVPSDSQRIEALEKRVEELEKLVGDYFKVPVEPSTDDGEDNPFNWVDYPLDEEKTPNQLRAEIIEKAKNFVEDNKNGYGDYEFTCKEGYRIAGYVEFLINKEKRKVVALMRGTVTGRIRSSGTAFCSKDDVFNEHIGKSIALGRALGLDVSEFEGAAQPTLAVGQKCSIKNWDGHNGKKLTITKVFGDGQKANHDYGYGYLTERTLTIINDTNAIYGEVE